jgi:hypothetical protein
LGKRVRLLEAPSFSVELLCHDDGPKKTNGSTTLILTRSVPTYTAIIIIY